MHILGNRVKFIALIIAAALVFLLAWVTPVQARIDGGCYIWYGGRGGNAVYFTMTERPGSDTDGALYAYASGEYKTYTSRIKIAIYVITDVGVKDIIVTVYDSQNRRICG